MRCSFNDVCDLLGANECAFAMEVDRTRPSAYAFRVSCYLLCLPGHVSKSNSSRLAKIWVVFAGSLDGRVLTPCFFFLNSSFQPILSESFLYLCDTIETSTLAGHSTHFWKTTDLHFCMI